MIPEICVSLIIQDEAITLDMLDKMKMLGATKYWEKGQLKPSITFPSHGCEFSSDPEKSYYADKTAIFFLKKLITLNPELFRLIQEHNLNPMLSVGEYAHDVMPSFYIESEDVKLLAKFSISINIDYIIVSDSDELNEQ